MTLKSLGSKTLDLIEFHCMKKKKEHLKKYICEMKKSYIFGTDLE